jgi:hypothetical protein
VTLTKGYRVFDPVKVTGGLGREMSKIHNAYKSLRPILPSQIEPKNLFLPSKVLIKQKLDDTISARVAIDGSRQPPGSYNEVDAGTSCTEKLLCLVSAVIADAAYRRVKFWIIGFDIAAAFLQQLLTRAHTNGIQYITRLPPNMPGELANQLNAIDMAHYGLKQSNNIFNTELHRLLTSNGYFPSILAPHIFKKICPDDKRNYLFVNMHVDDGAIVSTSESLTQELKSILTARYGQHKDFPLTWNPELTEYCGLQFVRHPNNDVQVHMEKHIKKFLHKQGMDDLPSALTPANPDFFDPPTNNTPVDPVMYQSTQGGLNFYGPVRTDIKLFVNILSKKNHHPVQSDRDKQIQVMRYLKGYSGAGPCFTSNPACYPDGAQVNGSSDLGFATLHNAQCTTGNLFTVGNNNASYASFASAEPGVALSPQEGEYLSFGRCAKDIIYWQQLLDGFGFKQKLPSIIYEDNLPAINLVKSPEITRNSRHIFVKHHYVRWLHQQGFILPVHQGTNDMAADFVTKVHLPRRFHYMKDVVFNSHPGLREALKKKHTIPEK